ncbi:MAG: 2-C-methyl-D-erythritol 2,4-cyclodiphosphate synthase [Oscillospiraceae bacterium]|nr:2-C-methyl-D-erythritol 2,4-cyclodiphosphate synthase [Oscillospiraceae bacterium]
MRIGHGYDAHRLMAGRKLILGGVEIPFEKGLEGHSDADVLLHALADAILGAAALGDIGHLFPDSDPATEGIDSRIILRAAAEKAAAAGYQVENCDVTIIAQRPKLAPYLDAMRGNIADDLGVALNAVSVKATTEEHMGFTGSGEGMSCHAVVLLS